MNYERTDPEFTYAVRDSFVSHIAMLRECLRESEARNVALQKSLDDLNAKYAKMQTAKLVEWVRS